MLVGDGDLRAEAQKRAEQLGILERILFVGASRDVGYWLQKMNVFILFSRYEGLPNVLIEAQMVGVPVISTPAGGSAECFIEGVSGFILDDAQTVNLDQLAAMQKSWSIYGAAEPVFANRRSHFYKNASPWNIWWERL